MLFHPRDVGSLHLGVNDAAICRSNLRLSDRYFLSGFESGGRMEEAQVRIETGRNDRVDIGSDLIEPFNQPSCRREVQLQLKTPDAHA